MWFGNDPIMSLFCVMNLYGISKVCVSLKFSTIIRRLDDKYSLGKMSLSSRCHWSHPSDHPLGFCFWWISACTFCKLFIMLCGNMRVMKSHTNAAPGFADANSSTQILKQKKRQQKNKKLGKKRAQIADADSHWSSGKICYVICSEVCTGTKIQLLGITTLQ